MSVLDSGIQLDFPREHSLLAILTLADVLSSRIHLHLFHQAGFALQWLSPYVYLAVLQLIG
eukprot:TsM_000082200 transcript=TsM_000082200 gene=TsM_000082200